MALKILSEAFASDPDRLARFQREAQVLASLNYPNIGHIYGLVEAEGQRALVLEHRDDHDNLQNTQVRMVLRTQSSQRRSERGSALCRQMGPQHSEGVARRSSAQVVTRPIRLFLRALRSGSEATPRVLGRMDGLQSDRQGIK